MAALEAALPLPQSVQAGLGSRCGRPQRGGPAAMMTAIRRRRTTRHCTALSTPELQQRRRQRCGPPSLQVRPLFSEVLALKVALGAAAAVGNRRCRRPGCMPGHPLLLQFRPQPARHGRASASLSLPTLTTIRAWVHYRGLRRQRLQQAAHGLAVAGLRRQRVLVSLGVLVALRMQDQAVSGASVALTMQDQAVLGASAVLTMQDLAVSGASAVRATLRLAVALAFAE